MIQDDDEFGGPDLDEMDTTTQRSRGMKGPRGGRGRPGRSQDPDLNRGMGPVAASPKRSRKSQSFPKMHGEQPDEGDNPFEGTAPMKKSKNQGGAYGGQGGGPPAKGSGKSEKHMGVAIIISPMANHAEEHRSSVRDSISKAIKTEKRRGPR